MATSTSSAKQWDSLTPADKLPAEWVEILSRLPGYDPIATAAGARFNTKAARAAIDFFPKYLRHVEGRLEGQPFVLAPWQEAWVANLFGWRVLDERGDVVRRYRETFGYVARKNGKTPLIAGLALLVLRLDPEKGQQNYIAAGEREQAGMLFRQCRGMLDRCDELADGCRVYGGAGAAGQSKSVVREADGSFLRVISADADTKHGGNTHLAIIDELHVQPNRDLYDVLRTSMASANRRQPLLVTITTADFDRPSICNEVYEYACKVRDGVVKDARFLPVIYEVPIDASWDDEREWSKANPNLNVSVSLEFLKAECAKAKETPAYEYTFRRLHLNQRTTTEVKAIDLARWDEIGGTVEEDELRERSCWAGLDLSTTTDVSALVLLFPEEIDGRQGYQVLPVMWVPGDAAHVRERRDRVPYATWARQGWLRMTQGNSVDYDQIRRDINELRERYNIVEIAADRWNATQLLQQLVDDAFSVVAFGQGYKDMTSPTKELLRLVADGTLRHGGHPVLRWMASNLALEQDAAGNLKPSKKKSTERIDGMAALVMALGRAIVRQDEPGLVSL